jgi:hypothetical protein
VDLRQVDAWNLNHCLPYIYVLQSRFSQLLLFFILLSSNQGTSKLQISNLHFYFKASKKAKRVFEAIGSFFTNKKKPQTSKSTTWVAAATTEYTTTSSLVLEQTQFTVPRTKRKSAILVGAAGSQRVAHNTTTHQNLAKRQGNEPLPPSLPLFSTTVSMGRGGYNKRPETSSSK